MHTTTVTARFPLRVTVRRMVDDDPDLSWLGDPNNYLGIPEPELFRYLHQDEERLDAYHNGDWYMLGIQAFADVTVDSTVQTIRSGGLWGIESDSDESYLREIENEQIAELRDILADLGLFSRTETLERSA